MKAKTKPPVAVIAAVVLLCLFLIFIHITSGIFARYTMKIKNPDNSVRGAAFDVSAEADTEHPVSIVADGTDENGIAAYTVTVKNDSEAAVRYVATIKLNDEDKAKLDDSSDKLSFSGYLAANSSAEKQVTLDMFEYFKQNDRYGTFSNDDISGSKGKFPFTVSVKFTQVD